MGHTNLLHGLERKIGALMGELIAKREEVERVEKLAAALPALCDRVWEIQTLIEATEMLIKSFKPDWRRDTIDPVRPHVHQIPIKLGEAGRKGMEVLRTASKPLTTREITEEVLRREGLINVPLATRERIRNTIDATLRKRRGSVVDSDGSWPQHWTARKMP
jgi:hypothetical protein